MSKSILKWGNMYPAKALSHLQEQGLITSQQKKDWNDLRNSPAHPRLSKQSEAGKLKRRRRIASCCGLFYRLLFNILEYQGPQYSFDAKECSETYPFIRVLPDLGLNDQEIAIPETNCRLNKPSLKKTHDELMNRYYVGRFIKLEISARKELQDITQPCNAMV